MTRIAFLGSASLIILSCATLPACGQQDETQAVLAQCSDPAPRDVDSCLERARVLDETNPSPEVQALIGRLIEMQARASEPPPAPPEMDHPPDDKGVSSYDVSPPTPPPSSDMGPLEPYQPPPPPQDEAPPDTQTAPADMAPPDPNAPPQGGTIIQTTPPPGDGSGAPH